MVREANAAARSQQIHGGCVRCLQGRATAERLLRCIRCPIRNHNDIFQDADAFVWQWLFIQHAQANTPAANNIGLIDNRDRLSDCD